MSGMIVTMVAMSVIGIAIRMWFVYAGVRAIRGARSSRADNEDYGLSFDEKVKRRLSELPREGDYRGPERRETPRQDY